MSSSNVIYKKITQRVPVNSTRPVIPTSASVNTAINNINTQQVPESVAGPVIQLSKPASAIYNTNTFTVSTASTAQIVRASKPTSVTSSIHYKDTVASNAPVNQSSVSSKTNAVIINNSISSCSAPILSNIPTNRLSAKRKISHLP